MQQFIRKNYPKGLNQEMSIFYLKQIMNGFMEIRRYEVMHRDFKPGNIFLKDNNTLVIGDFGFANHNKEFANSLVGRD